jgi:hypothetical protein
MSDARCYLGWCFDSRCLVGLIIHSLGLTAFLYDCLLVAMIPAYSCSTGVRPNARRCYSGVRWLLGLALKQPYWYAEHRTNRPIGRTDDLTSHEDRITEFEGDIQQPSMSKGSCGAIPRMFGILRADAGPRVDIVRGGFATFATVCHWGNDSR